ncbi:MAG: hypothetical protein QF473_12850 [Planctomycetota bacterium]|nr:hypothetical protein [Planctomycetota bacterium]
MSNNEKTERETVRDLAKRVADLAAGEENAYRLRLWNDVNSLRNPDRPPVICHPACWEELMPRSGVVSQDSFHAGVEYRLRQILYKQEIGDDTVVEPWWDVPVVLKQQSEHFWGVPIGYTHSGVSGGAWSYVPPIREEADIDKIVPPQYTHCPEKTEENLSRMHDLLGDILPVRVTCRLPGPGAWLHGWATQLCGVQELLVHLMDRPGWVHRLMGILRDGFMGVMDQLDRMKVLTLNNTGLYACDDLPLSDFDEKRVRLKDLWGRGESQEFEGVGPAQYQEFLLDYQKPILERFGLTFYGCCENLTTKIDRVLGIPNLRKFVCSPWTDIEKLVDAVGSRYCIEWRQKATDVVFTPDMAPIRKHLERGLHIAKDTPIQIVLQELETVDGRPDRLREWAAAAKEIGAEMN